MSEKRVKTIEKCIEHDLVNNDGMMISIDYKEVRWLIEQAELASHFSKKNGELNGFLNKYSEATHWGRNVFDVAMDIITKQAKHVEELKDDKVELYKLNAKFGVKAWDIEQQNKRYREALEYIADNKIEHGWHLKAVNCVVRARKALESESSE